MKHVEITLPAMGEGIFEATVTQWLVAEGDSVSEDQSLVEVATDKVDSEIPASQNGTVAKLLVKQGEVAKVGQVLMLLKVAADSGESTAPEKPTAVEVDSASEAKPYTQFEAHVTAMHHPAIPHKLSNGAFLSPLVRSMAEKEGITPEQLETLSGTGENGRITRHDIANLLQQRHGKPAKASEKPQVVEVTEQSFEILEMNRMRKLIADNMVRSKQVSPHVTSFHEVDVTNMVTWRTKYMAAFEQKYKQKLTFTPIFIEAIALAIREYPMINVSVDGVKIIKKNNVNIGMATALPDGNLIVPVIKQADTLSLAGLAAQVNDLADRARNKMLKPDEIQGGTFTVTNVGSFGNLSGTPIINQPEVAILALGAIKKRVAVIESESGDTIGIRNIMILSLSYDHRVVDGSLGGMFLKKVADLLEAFSLQRPI